MGRIVIQAWRRLARAAVPVVIVTQRESGLWALPTSDVERGRTYGRAGTTEARQRAADPFGHDSISVTWRALHSLHSATQGVPSTILMDAFRALEDLRSPDGAYGRRREGWKSEASVNVSARHTAAALMMQLELGAFVSPRVQIEELLPTVQWLLDHQLDTGGWPYQQAHADDGDEPISTAYVLAALCEFERQVTEDHRSGLGEVARFDDALTRGFDRLLAMRSSKIWKFEYDQMDTQMADSSHVGWMLLTATVRNSALTRLEPRARSVAVEIALWIISQCKDEGMPPYVGSQEVSFAATAHTLLMALSLADSEVTNEAMRAIERLKAGILAAVKHHDYWRQVSAWDWCVVAQLPSGIVGSESTIGHELVELSEAVRRRGFSGNLLRQNLSSRRASIPAIGRMPIRYALSRGQPNSIPSNQLTAFYDSWPGWIKWVVAQAPAAAIGYYLSEVLQRLG